MKLQITKNKGKPHIILYHRDNGTQTWMHADAFFVLHDLSHFALEKTLGYKNAFLGTVNKGVDVKDFENPEKRKQMGLGKEAAYAENMANLFLIELLQGNFDDFNQILNQAFKPMDKQLSVPILSDKEIFSVRTYLQALITQWKQLQSSETMHLDYQC
ncbi:MAG TPA: hypothetical protein VNV85_11505 [Puia sp.]|jgi:hypothetical protein|nr:hypothetical protein [Puia sp.]